MASLSTTSSSCTPSDSDAIIWHHRHFLGGHDDLASKHTRAPSPRRRRRRRRYYNRESDTGCVGSDPHDHETWRTTENAASALEFCKSEIVTTSLKCKYD